MPVQYPVRLKASPSLRLAPRSGSNIKRSGRPLMPFGQQLLLAQARENFFMNFDDVWMRYSSWFTFCKGSCWEMFPRIASVCLNFLFTMKKVRVLYAIRSKEFFQGLDLTRYDSDQLFVRHPYLEKNRWRSSHPQRIKMKALRWNRHESDKYYKLSKGIENLNRTANKGTPLIGDRYQFDRNRSKIGSATV